MTGKPDYKKIAPEELVILARAGDDEALRLIYAGHREMLRSKANLYFMIGADRDDVIQEGMIGLLSAIRTFDPDAGATFKTFAELCVKRRIINAVKMAGRQKHKPLNESVSIDAAVEASAGTAESGGIAGFEDRLRAPGTTDPEEIVLLADLLDYVESNAPALFSEMERMVWSAYSHGGSASQIAESFGKSQKSIDNTLTRIKGKIERLISVY